MNMEQAIYVMEMDYVNFVITMQIARTLNVVMMVVEEHAETAQCYMTQVIIATSILIYVKCALLIAAVEENVVQQ